jgi:hypothetical protein
MSTRDGISFKQKFYSFASNPFSQRDFSSSLEKHLNQSIRYARPFL